jgi:hypothetical protein
MPILKALSGPAIFTLIGAHYLGDDIALQEQVVFLISDVLSLHTSNIILPSLQRLYLPAIVVLQVLMERRE